MEVNINVGSKDAMAAVNTAEAMINESPFGLNEPEAGDKTLPPKIKKAPNKIKAVTKVRSPQYAAIDLHEQILASFPSYVFA